jgi:hypothetical protein
MESRYITTIYAFAHRLSWRAVTVLPYADLAARLIAEPRRGACRIIGVDGRSGAGKSTVAEPLAAALGAPVVHLDDFVPGWDGLAESVDLLVEWVLAPASAGRPVRWRRYDWEPALYAEWHETVVDRADGVLVVEGSGCGARRAARFMSALLWIETPDDVRRERLAARADGAAYAPFLDRWARQEAAVVASDAAPARAGVVVDNGRATADLTPGHVIVTRLSSLRVMRAP